jgi:hypothetical protein
LASTSDSRTKKDILLETLGVDFSKCSPEFSNTEQAKLADLSLSNKEAFAIEGEDIGLYPVQARIPSIPDRAFNQPQHPIDYVHRKLVDTEVKTMYDDGIIMDFLDSKGWNSPVFIIENSDGSPRFVVNF